MILCQGIVITKGMSAVWGHPDILSLEEEAAREDWAASEAEEQQPGDQMRQGTEEGVVNRSNVAQRSSKVSPGIEPFLALFFR